MLPPEFYHLIQQFRDYEQQHAQDLKSQKNSVWHRVKSWFFLLLLAVFTLVFVYYSFEQHLQPWILWLV
jgi:uncharacterized membrane protein